MNRKNSFLFWTPGVLAMLVAAPAHAEDCTGEAARLLPAAKDFAALCPKDVIFATPTKEKKTPAGGCTRTFGVGLDFVNVSSNWQNPAAAKTAQAGAELAADVLGKMGGKKPAVRKVPFASVEVFELEGMPGYFTAVKGRVLVVSVVGAGATPSAACAEAIVRASRDTASK